MARRKADEIILSDEERAFFEGQTRRRNVPRALATRCRIILLYAEGPADVDVVDRAGTHFQALGKWRRRFAMHRLGGLADGHRPGGACR